MKVKNEFCGESTKKLANIQKPTNGAKKIRQKASQKEDVKLFNITTFFDKFSLVEKQDKCRRILFIAFVKVLVHKARRLHEF